MPKCPNCGIVVNTDFCPNCGTVFQEEISKSAKYFCPNCGTENETRFCSECGADNLSLIEKIESLNNQTPKENNITVPKPDDTTSTKPKRMKRNIAIILTACILTVAVISLVICFNIGSKKDYSLSDISFKVPSSWTAKSEDSLSFEEVEDSDWKGYTFAYNETDSSGLVFIKVTPMSIADYNEMIESDGNDEKTLFTYLNYDAITFIDDNESDFATGKYFYYNGKVYFFCVNPYNEQGVNNTEKESASRILSEIFKTVKAEEITYIIGDIKFTVAENCTYVGVPDDLEYGEQQSFIFGEDDKRGHLEIRAFEGDYEYFRDNFKKDYEIDDNFTLFGSEAYTFTISDDNSEYKIGAFFSYNSKGYAINLSSFSDTEIDEDFRTSSQRTLKYVIGSIKELN